MAAPLASRSPTCLNCLRRLASPAARSSCASLPAATAAASYIQVRGKKKIPRSEKQGVVVRLLEDIPKFGRKDAILHVQRGRMRNLWYPAKRAEYMTADRFRELGLTRNDVGERDPVFGTAAPAAEDFDVPEDEPIAPAVEVESLAPMRAHALLSFLVPTTLTFSRKPIHAPAPQQPRSPLLASNASLSASSSSSTPTAEEEKDDKEQAIFGSVSTTDVVASIKDLLVTDPEASRIAISHDNVRFLGLEDDADRVKTLGTWDVEISVDGAGGGNSDAAPIRRVVQVVAGE